MHRAARNWLKISVRVDPQLTDAVAAYLGDLAGSGLEITGVPNGCSAKGAPFPEETLIAYLALDSAPADKDAAEKIEALRQFLTEVHAFFPGCPAPVFQTETIREEDWGRKWKSFFTTLQISPRLAIKPSWEVAAQPACGGSHQGKIIEMDPGLAFGTGHHASTQLALLLLEELFLNSLEKPGKVLDAGTGSGILAMACALFGAREVTALDIDADAVETARQNVGRNNLADRVSVSGREISAMTPGFDLVVANITHDVLAVHAKLLASLMNPGGFLVLSGILQGEQEHSIAEIYSAQGLVPIRTLARDEWVALEFHKKMP